MSLATTSGVGMGGGAGAGAGGIVMAHQANAMARPAAQPPPTNANAIPPPSGSAPPPSAAALGADLLDKQQSLSMKQVRNLSRLPMVAIDLFGSDPHVATFPPKSKDPAESAMAHASIVGKMKGDVWLKPTESAHKVFRKYLAKSKPYSALQTDVLTKSDDDDAIKIERPQQWLGLRRLSDAPEFLRKKVSAESSSSSDGKQHAIEEEASQETGVTMVDGTLDGSVPQGDDFDRVVCKVRLHTSKKALTVLPEEGVELLIHQAQHHVARKVGATQEDEDIDEYPCAIAVPAYFCHDAAMEALLDATAGKGVIFQRSMCALAGALRPGAEGKPNTLLEEVNKQRAAMAKEFQRQHAQDPEAIPPDDTLLLLLGMTHDGFECTAVQVSAVQPNNLNWVFGNFNVLCNCSYQDANPETLIEKCINEIQSTLKAVAPETDTPAVLVTYGSPNQQKIIEQNWKNMQANLESWKDLPLVSTKADCIALGTAILGGVSHGRIAVVKQIPGKKPKATLGIRIQNVSPVAVGIRMNYHGGADNKWTPVKTIFDFDRRVPAGPYPIELKASECVLHRSGQSNLSDEEFLKATKEKEGSKHIPQREEAALELRVQVLQKWSRQDEWKKVGDPKKPLVKTESNDDDDKQDCEVACESVELQLSLGPTGIITADLVGERESVVQATQSARNSAIRYYVGILLAIVFFGGFLVKSYWEERVFNRDTKRLLAYYKHVTPGSMHDGDEHSARYLVWKYRGKKEKLWRNLEKKYGEPVLHAHEWPDDEEKEEEELTQDLDEDEDEDEDAEEEKDEPDL